MGIVISEYEQRHEPFVRDFNERLKAGGSSFQFPETCIRGSYAKGDGVKLYMECFLALEGESQVRGAYMLKHQGFFFKGKERSIGIYSLPLSEGIVDKAYGMVGVKLLMDALKRDKCMFVLGMGGEERPLPRMLKSFNWELYTIPFFFKINNASKFLDEIEYLRKKIIYRKIVDVLKISRLGHLAIRLIQLRPGNKFGRRGVKVKVENSFSEWADRVWDINKKKYDFTAVRDKEVLNKLFPIDDNRFTRLRVLKGDDDIGWAVIQSYEMKKDKYFGNMKVGMIVDCFSSPEDAGIIIQSAWEYIKSTDIDISVSNQSHLKWINALKGNGFLKGPSNFAIAASVDLAKMMNPFSRNINKAHINRADGDGPDTPQNN